jgi:type IV pilus assembly protein PilC
MLEPLLIVIMGLLIGFMVASIMIPMFDSYNQI